VRSDAVVAPGGAAVTTHAPDTLGWWEDGERLFAGALGRMVEEEADGPSLLPGWSRRTLLAHVARNADALVNLLTWARTGEETPMYASVEAREAGIAETARLPFRALHDEVLAATERLATAVRELPDEKWTATVRTMGGRPVPASEVPWMRCREVWVHAVDLATGTEFRDVPEEVLARLVDDVWTMWEARDETPALTVFAGGRDWGGEGGVAVSGSLPDVVAWLTGRADGSALQADGQLPDLPPWLP
jgi:maleylpyruvate isomerase